MWNWFNRGICKALESQAVAELEERLQRAQQLRLVDKVDGSEVTMYLYKGNHLLAVGDLFNYNALIYDECDTAGGQVHTPLRPAPWRQRLLVCFEYFCFDDDVDNPRRGLTTLQFNNSGMTCMLSPADFCAFLHGLVCLIEARCVDAKRGRCAPVGRGARRCHCARINTARQKHTMWSWFNRGICRALESQAVAELEERLQRAQQLRLLDESQGVSLRIVCVFKGEQLLAMGTLFDNAALAYDSVEDQHRLLCHRPTLWAPLICSPQGAHVFQACRGLTHVQLSTSGPDCLLSPADLRAFLRALLDLIETHCTDAVRQGNAGAVRQLAAALDVEL